MDKKVEVSMKLINTILAYLGTCKYQEVFQIVNAIESEVEPQLKQPSEPAK